MIDFVLASSSPARKKVLTGAGFVFRVQVSEVDEDALLADALEHNATLDIRDQVGLLAAAKAQAVADTLTPSHHTTVVLGCDSMLLSDIGITGKPYTTERAIEIMQHTSGQDVELYTGHTLIELRPDGQHRSLHRTVVTTVHMAKLTPQEIHAYAASGEPLGVAGAFTIDGLGGPFIRGVTGDHHNVLGLSLPHLRDMLGELGYTVSQFWGKD